MRFRITTRRNGNVGRTTDNVSIESGLDLLDFWFFVVISPGLGQIYIGNEEQPINDALPGTCLCFDVLQFYYSPCGKTFRTHKQVAEFLGLEPQPVHPPRSQAQHPAFEVVVLSVKTASAAGKVNNAGEHVEPVSGHTACQETLLSAEPIQQVGNKLGCSTATHKSVALPAASSCASEVCTVLPEQQRMQWQQQMAPAAVRKHTKNMLAAKYSCTSNGESHRSLGTCSVSSRGRLSAAAAGHTAESALAPSLHQQSAQVPGPAIKSQLGSEQRQKRRHMSAAQQVQLTAGPTDSACSQSTGNTNMAAPPPKRKKCPQQPAWRANLRALATAQYAAMLAEKQKANSSSGNETGNPCSSSSTTTTT
jgi:hypothetical protein